MYCSNCGAKNSEGAVFCGNCGNRQMQETIGIKKKAKRKTKSVIIGLLLMVLVAGGLIAVYLYVSTGTGMRGEVYTKGRTALEYGGTHYYIFTSNLYKSEADGSESTVLLENVGDRLWLVRGKLILMWNLQIVSFDPETETIQVLADGSDDRTVQRIFEVNNTGTKLLFVCKDEKRQQLWDYNIEAGTKELIDSNVMVNYALHVSDDIVYIAHREDGNSYTESMSYGMYKKCPGQKAELLLKPEQEDTYFFADGEQSGWLYFRHTGIIRENDSYSGDRLSRINVQTEEIEILHDREDDYWISTVYLTQEYLLYGENKQKLNDDGSVDMVKTIDFKTSRGRIQGDVAYSVNTSNIPEKLSIFVYDLKTDEKVEWDIYQNEDGLEVSTVSPVEIVGNYIYTFAYVIEEEYELRQCTPICLKTNRVTGETIVIHNI